jgi:hypothetical protein
MFQEDQAPLGGSRIFNIFCIFYKDPSVIQGVFSTRVMPPPLLFQKFDFSCCKNSEIHAIFLNLVFLQVVYFT